MIGKLNSSNKKKKKYFLFNLVLVLIDPLSGNVLNFVRILRLIIWFDDS